MAAGLGFKTFVSGDVLTAADTNGYLMQGVLVFTTTTARDAAITSPQEGQFAFTKDADSLFYYDGSSWVATSLAADITGVTAGTAISGGGTSGTVTVNVDVNAASTVTATSSDYILISDVTDNSTKKALISDVVATGDITAVNTAANSSLAGGATSGAVSLTASVHNSTAATAASADYVLIADTDDSNATKKALISDIVSLVPASDPIPLILALS